MLLKLWHGMGFSGELFWAHGVSCVATHFHAADMIRCRKGKLPSTGMLRELQAILRRVEFDGIRRAASNKARKSY
jgi:hypothetical protein